MPIGTNQQSTIVRTDQITHEEIISLAEAEIDTATFYAFDEFFNSVNNYLISKNTQVSWVEKTSIYIPTQELIDILLPVWEAHLPVPEILSI